MAICRRGSLSQRNQTILKFKFAYEAGESQWDCKRLNMNEIQNARSLPIGGVWRILNFIHIHALAAPLAVAGFDMQI